MNDNDFKASYSKLKNLYMSAVLKEYYMTNIISVDAANLVFVDYPVSPTGFKREKFLNKFYEELLAESEADTILFTAGGSGSGKTTFVKKLNSAPEQILFYDSPFCNADWGGTVVEDALAAQKQVQILYVYRDAVESYIYRLFPKINTGRKGNLSTHIYTHLHSLDTVLRIKRRYGNKIIIWFLNNSTSFLGFDYFAQIEDIPLKTLLLINHKYTKRYLYGYLLSATKQALEQKCITSEEYALLIE
jgi:hypothetical protein